MLCLTQRQGSLLAGPKGDDIFGYKQSDSYINKLKQNYSGNVYVGESPDFEGGFGGNYFTEEFKNYAKSQGYAIDNNLAIADGPQILKYTGQGEPFTQQPQFQYPQSYMSNYITPDGKSIAPPFESSRSPLDLYTTKEDYISYASKSYDDRRAYYNNEIKKLTDRGFVLQADGFYRSPNTGGASKISGFDDVLKQTKEQYVAKQLEAKGRYDVERAGAPSGLPDFMGETKARIIKEDKENISRTNEQLAKIGLSPIDVNYYDSPEYKYYLDNRSRISMPAFGFSKYFGPQSSQEPGVAEKKHMKLI